ncbi:protein-S-isoprenylcysteine O-methyltransferase Ste14 [Nitrobacteraceae bacterium AZCC 2161]|jgi:protein-S-isoprenylcysteine O-methyltransferase Ste14
MAVPTNVPKNVFYFEVLLYMSLTLDALSIAFQDRTPDAVMSDTTIMAANIVAACMLLLFVYLVWLAAQRRKSWPRWLLVASLVFSVLSLLQILGVNGLQFDSAIEIVSCALTAAGLYCAFTGDAKDWFNG